MQPAPAPRFSRTPGEIRADGDGSADEVLRAWGLSEQELAHR